MSNEQVRETARPAKAGSGYGAARGLGSPGVRAGLEIKTSRAKAGGPNLPVDNLQGGRDSGRRPRALVAGAGVYL